MANSAGDRLDSLLSLMARLRSEGGCPWDREQTRASLRPYLLEEAYEVLEAIDEGSNDHLIEELGDLLFQVVFHCQIASERGEFTMAEVLGRLSDKMIRRHPHVFGDRVVADAREALAQWERIKHDEGGGDGRPRSALDGVPAKLPALLGPTPKTDALFYTRWRSLLRDLASLENYRKIFGARMEPELVIQFILFDAHAPRALNYGCHAVKDYLERIAGTDERTAPVRVMGRLCARLAYDDTDVMRHGEVLVFLLGILTDLDKAHETLSAHYFVT